MSPSWYRSLLRIRRGGTWHPTGDGDPVQLVIVAVRGRAVDVEVLVRAVVLIHDGRDVRSTQRKPKILVELRSLGAEEDDGEVDALSIERERPETFHVRGMMSNPSRRLTGKVIANVPSDGLSGESWSCE